MLMIIDKFYVVFCDTLNVSKTTNPFLKCDWSVNLNEKCSKERISLTKKCSIFRGNITILILMTIMELLGSEFIVEISMEIMITHLA